MRPEALKDKLATLPDTPGVYFLKDAQGRTIYIGKAKSLRNRVTTYFHASYGEFDPKIQAMVSLVGDVEWVETPTEVDALLMEARLVKDTQPKYNIKLKDDKSFTMLALTRFDDFPKAWVVRETDEIDADTWGPFTSAADLREAVKVLQKIFKFATCKIAMMESDDKRRHFRPCLLYSIKRCTAPCAALVSKEDYAADIESLKRFLRGEREPLLEDLRARMKSAAKALDFERAAELRDRVRALEALARKSSDAEYIEGDITPMDPREGLEEIARRFRFSAPPRTIEGVDIAHIRGQETVGSLVSFVDGIPFKSGYRRYRIKTAEGGDDFAAIREVVRRRFKRLKDEGEAFPDVLLIDGGVGQYNVAAEELAALGVGRTLLLSLAKEEETLIHQARPVPLEKSSAALRLFMYVRDEAHRFAQHYHHLLRRKAVLHE